MPAPQRPTTRARSATLQDSFTATINYINGPLSLFTNFNYTGPVNQGVDEAANFREHERISSFLVVNSGGTVDVGHRFRFFVDVDNIFNKKPPYPVPAFGGATTYFPGILGRYYRFGAGVHLLGSSGACCLRQKCHPGHSLPTKRGLAAN